MVLWEITLATAYFLGLKQTYKFALRIQRRLVSPTHPQMRQFLHGRTRAVFDMAVKVHQNIQNRDIEVGRNLGNWMLQWLNPMRPLAEVHGHSNGPITSLKTLKPASRSVSLKRSRAVIDQKFNRYYMFIASSASRWPKPFPRIALMMRQPKPAGTMVQHRYYGIEAMPLTYRRGSFDHVVRRNFLQWMLGNEKMFSSCSSNGN